MDYVLTGKFQTDQLESRFGHYRQLSRSNYLVSVADILQSAGMFLSCDDCDKEWSIMIHKALVCFSNILLSEYCSVQTDKVSTAKIAREISKF